MASLDGLDLSNVEADAGFDVIPAGEYTAVIVASERKRTSTGSGEYIKLELQITDGGKYQNRKLWDNLNILSSGPKKETTEMIAKRKLKAICVAVNTPEPTDSSDLHMKPLRLSVGVKKREDTGEMQNIIKAYKPRSASPVATPQMTTAGASNAEQTPW